jgi:spore cortex formation protein SpoVR/YcgB (stage V sporulation)
MWNYLPEIKKVFSNILQRTNDLEDLAKRVDEILCDELIRECSLHRYHKQATQGVFSYEIHKDDYNHITKHLHLLQTVIAPDMVVTAQTTKDEYRVIFKKG